MPAKSCPSIILPKDWPRSIKSALLQVISFAQLAIAYTRGWAANCPNARIRLKARLDRAQQEIALLREQLRINNLRMEVIPPNRRPHYPPQERMAILELKAARGWSLKQTARVFSVTSATIASWMKRLDEDGPHALVQVPQPVNRFPDFVCHVVQRLKTLCPTLGKALIAKILSRAGLHLGNNHRRPNAPAKTPASPSHRRPRARRKATHRHRPVPWPCLACRPHGGAHWSRVLGSLASLCAAPVLALLSLAGGRRGSFFQASDGLHRVPGPTYIARVASIPGPRYGQGEE